MRFTLIIVSLAVGSLVFTQGCGNSSPPSSGLWSCFDTGTQTACTQVSALSTTDQDVNGDGVPDHFVCADDDNDGHDRGRDRHSTQRDCRPAGDPCPFGRGAGWKREPGKRRHRHLHGSLWRR